VAPGASLQVGQGHVMKKFIELKSLPGELSLYNAQKDNLQAGFKPTCGLSCATLERTVKL
jgi:hypothetical protein